MEVLGEAESNDSARNELRRLIPRQFADWHGTYMIEGDPEKRWRHCRVTDISSAGAGLQLDEASPEAQAGTRIILNVQLKAEIRYIREDPHEPGLKVGTQFVDLTDSERAYIASLEALNARW